MSQKISMEEILELNNAQILELSKLCGLTWQFWEKEEHIEDARKAYETKKLKHHFFSKLESSMTSDKMVEILGSIEVYKIAMEIFIKTTGYTKLCVFVDDFNNKKCYEDECLTLALWLAVKDLIFCIEE